MTPLKAENAAEVRTKINAAIDMLERARDRADRNAAMSARLSRQELRFLLGLVKRLEEERQS